MEPATYRTFATFDGTEIWFNVFGDQESTDPCPLILQHGFASDSRGNWPSALVADLVTKGGRQVITVDARGHGRSGKPHDPSQYGHVTMARDISAFVDHLGVSQFDLGGYSMGAHIALHVVSKDSRVRRVMFSGIGANAIGGTAIAGFSTAKIADGIEAHLNDPGVRLEDPNARAFVAFARSQHGDLRALLAQMRANNDPITTLSTLSMPSLVLAGQDDHLATTADELAKALGSQHITTPGDHLNAIYTAEFAAAVLTFFTH
jgi:pimeloyl-ACP methyl ester carboxylesterase